MDFAGNTHPKAVGTDLSGALVRDKASMRLTLLQKLRARMPRFGGLLPQ